FLGVPLDDVGGDQYLEARLGDDLALLLRHRARDRIGALTHQVGGLAQDLGAVIGRGRAPDLEALGGRCQPLIEDSPACMWQRRGRLLGRGIDDIVALATAAILPFAADIERKIGVHGNLTRDTWIRDRWMARV